MSTAKKTAHSELKAYLDAAITTAQAMQGIADRLATTRTALADAEALVASKTKLRDDLKSKVARMISNGEILEAEQTGKIIRESVDAIEVATVNVEHYRGAVAAMEEELLSSEDVADIAHRNFHGHASDAMRPELVALIQGPFRKAWRHYIASGKLISFDNWLKSLLSDAGVHANENLSAPCDLGHPEHAPCCLGMTDRNAIRDRVFTKRHAAEEAKNKAAHDAYWAAQATEESA